MNAIQTQTKIARLKLYIDKTNDLISQATDPQKVLFFKRELAKTKAVIEQLSK